MRQLHRFGVRTPLRRVEDSRTLQDVWRIVGQFARSDGHSSGTLRRADDLPTCACESVSLIPCCQLIARSRIGLSTKRKRSERDLHTVPVGQAADRGKHEFPVAPPRNECPKSMQFDRIARADNELRPSSATAILLHKRVGATSRWWRDSGKRYEEVIYVGRRHTRARLCEFNATNSHPNEDGMFRVMSSDVQNARWTTAFNSRHWLVRTNRTCYRLSHAAPN